MTKDPEETPCLLYLITPPAIDLSTFPAQFEAALDAGEVGCSQLRLPEADDDTLCRTIEALMPIAHQREIAFLLEERADLAKKMGCDGVHVSSDDKGYKKARGVVGTDAIVGVSCYNSRHLAMVDAEAGADYISFGAFFPSPSKQTEHRAKIETLQWWASFMEVPCTAVGGITPDNCGPLVEAGADFITVISAVWSHPEGPAAGVKAMNDAITAHAPQAT